MLKPAPSCLIDFESWNPAGDQQGPRDVQVRSGADHHNDEEQSPDPLPDGPAQKLPTLPELIHLLPAQIPGKHQQNLHFLLRPELCFDKRGKQGLRSDSQAGSGSL